MSFTGVTQNPTLLRVGLDFFRSLQLRTCGLAITSSTKRSAITNEISSFMNNLQKIGTSCQKNYAITNISEIKKICTFSIATTS